MLRNTLILASLLGSAQAVAYPVPYQRSVELEKEVIENYAQLVFLNYSDALAGATKLHVSVKSFVTAAATGNTQLSQKLMDVTKSVWTTEARMPYGQSEIFRFYNGPIDFEPINDGTTSYLESINFEGVEGLLNAWPLDEAYIDYVEGAPNTGLINDRSVSLSKDVIVSMNELNGEKNISTGYHAVEFLLWGQDRDQMSAGKRMATDYIDGEKENADRRREYLGLLSGTIVEHLGKVTAQWTPASTNYRKEFVGRDSREGLAFLFTAMISMAGDELKSERIENALLLEDQEEEHSCFSDTTVNDIYTNALGVKNVYYGQYTGTNMNVSLDGAGVDELVEFVNPTLNAEIKAAFENVFSGINAFYATDAAGNVEVGNIVLPFDVAITSEQSKVQKIVDDLDHLDELLREAATELGLALEI
ncbi:MAG: iron-regulated protein [Halobacteriovoraceae bacterium]|nr:iron-regulated protein [Halobacteriovoraceae bacterium]|tara:strand:+ start:65071 stop:66327 length:1257 start_codon:yes stop_codon:yes gene_type:complete